MITLPSIDPPTETKIITTFIHDTFEKNGKNKAIIAVSGGVDSATSLVLTTHALGPENVHTLHLPSKTSNPQSTLDAQLAINAAAIPPQNQLTINISTLIKKSWRINRRSSDAGNQELARAASHLATDQIAVSTPNSDAESLSIINRLRLANLAARIRMMLLFDQAKKLDALVIGTENLSEHLLGYYTRFGDEASDLEPLRHLYKTQVYELARYLKVPESILNKKPSADLWPGQTDDHELGFTYQEADPILHALSQNLPLDPSPLVDLVTQTVNRNAFKHLVPYILQGSKNLRPEREPAI